MNLSLAEELNAANDSKPKFEAPFTLKALDSNFELVSLVSYSNLQWNRKFHEPGSFSVVIDADQYSPEWKYLYSEKRRELGEISQINWNKEANSQELTLSGLFMEKELNRMIVYPRPTNFDNDAGTHYGTSIIKEADTPTWLIQKGTADKVALAFFEGFRKIKWRNYRLNGLTVEALETREIALNIEAGTIAPGEYKPASHTRNGERLGNKLFDILSESLASPAIDFDYYAEKFKFNILHGTDRTIDNPDTEINPVVLSSTNGTVTKAQIVKANTETKDAVLSISESDDLTLVLVNADKNGFGRFEKQDMNSKQGDYITEETVDKPAGDRQHKLAVAADAALALYDKKDKFNVELELNKGSYRYMEDFDLGDKITIEVPEMKLSINAQIICCFEVVKEGTWSVSIEIGTPLLRKRG